MTGGLSCLQEGYIIHIGQLVQVRTGDTLDKLAARFGTTLRQVSPPPFLPPSLRLPLSLSRSRCILLVASVPLLASGRPSVESISSLHAWVH